MTKQLHRDPPSRFRRLKKKTKTSPGNSLEDGLVENAVTCNQSVPHTKSTNTTAPTALSRQTVSAGKFRKLKKRVETKVLGNSGQQLSSRTHGQEIQAIEQFNASISDVAATKKTVRACGGDRAIQGACDRTKQVPSRIRPLNLNQKAVPTEVCTVGDEIMVMQVFSGLGMPSGSGTPIASTLSPRNQRSLDQRSRSEEDDNGVAFPADVSDDQQTKQQYVPTDSPTESSGALNVASRFLSGETKSDLVSSAETNTDRQFLQAVVTKKQTCHSPRLSDEHADVSEAGAFSLNELKRQISAFDQHGHLVSLDRSNDQQEDEAYGAWFCRVILKHPAASWVTACYFYMLVVLALVAIVIQVPESTGSLLVESGFAENRPLATPEFEVSATPEPLQAEVTEQLITDTTQPVLDSAINEVVPLPMLPKNFSKAAVAATNGDDATKMLTAHPVSIDRSPENATRKGSFAVWTEPQNPELGQAYSIIIQIELPAGIQKYSVSDLQGLVIGSDGYRKPIPGNLRGFLPVINGFSQLRIPIVSADQHVQDVIYIKSRLLKETHKLSISFE